MYKKREVISSKNKITTFFEKLGFPFRVCIFEGFECKDHKRNSRGDFERVNLCFKVIPINATRFITVQWSGSNIIKVELVPKNIQEHL